MVPRAGQPLRPPFWRTGTANSKASIASPSPSFEGDDERSLLGDASDMESDAGSHILPKVPKYPGEDTRPTSQKELLGWYSYGWASEVFVVCGVGSFIPITLEQLAREVGVLLSDHETPCPTRAVKDAIKRGSMMERQVADGSQHCVVQILGSEVDTASFAMYTFSLSVLVQALVIISMSGAADHGRYRKSLLLIFAGIGAIATMLFLPLVPQVFMLGAFFAIVANTCFGASYVLLNSFLPLLVRRHPSIPSEEEEPIAFRGGEFGEEPEEQQPSLADSTAALLPSQPPSTNLTPPTKLSSPELRLSTKISAYGVGIGYIAAVTVQIIGMFVLFAMEQSLMSLKLVLFIIGLWWLVFTIPPALFLRPRPGPPLAASHTGSWWLYLSHSWAMLGRTILQARRLKDISIFLIAWFLLSDALATVSSTAILFARTDLNMNPLALAFISVIATIFGVCGAFAWSAVSRRYSFSPVQTLALIILLFELIPLYGLLGYIPAIRRLGVLGLQADWEMYVVGAVYGLVLGGVGAYCRSLFGELIPPGSEAAFYALYAITDKGSSIFGPAIVGAITDRFGEIRPAFVFLAVLIGLPLPLLLMVDVSRGRAQGRLLVSMEGNLSSPDGVVYTPVSVVVSEEGGDGEDRVLVAGDHIMSTD